MNGSRWLAVFLLVAPFIGRAGVDEDSTRVLGRSLAGRIVAEASLEKGQTVSITWSGDGGFDHRFADGLIEGLMSWGVIVKADRPAETRNVFALDVSRVAHANGRESYAVKLLSRETNAYVLVKEYILPDEDESVLDRWGVPLVITGAVSIIVYLLLTVRSS